MLSIDIKLLAERGDESMELLVEISEWERFRLRTIVAFEIFKRCGVELGRMIMDFGYSRVMNDGQKGGEIQGIHDMAEAGAGWTRCLSRNTLARVLPRLLTSLHFYLHLD